MRLPARSTQSRRFPGSARGEPRAFRSRGEDVSIPQRLDWKAFCARFFPGRRRHDLEALHAYGAYRKGLPVGKAGPSDAAVEVWEGEGGR